LKKLFLQMIQNDKLSYLIVKGYFEPIIQYEKSLHLYTFPFKSVCLFHFQQRQQLDQHRYFTQPIHTQGQIFGCNHLLVICLGRFSVQNLYSCRYI